MVDAAVGELIAAAGHAIVEDNEFFKEKKKGHLFLRVLYYLVPMSILTGFTSGLLIISSRTHHLPKEDLQQYQGFLGLHS